MQKAVIVRNVVDENAGQSWSYEVDPTEQTAAAPLRDLLARGWQVIHACPMPSELDSCCLVILQQPGSTTKGASPVPLAEVSRGSSWLKLQTPTRSASGSDWSGETIPLDQLGITEV